MKTRPITTTNQNMNSSNKQNTSSIFANKSDLIAAQNRIAELEAELATVRTSPSGSQIATLQKQNAAVKVRPPAVATNATTAPAASTWQKPVNPTMSRAEFDTMNPEQKSSFCRAGGRLTH